MIFSLTILAFIFILGLVIGSFLNVVILRTVSEESIITPASKCPKCQTTLKWYHNIPLLSYICLRGKCAYCKEHISIQYPIVELLTGIIFVGLFIKFCSPFDPLFGLSSINPISYVQVFIYLFSLIVSCLFIVIAGTDILEKKVSNTHTYSLIGMGILYSVIYSILSIILYTKAFGFPKLNIEFFLTCPILYSLAAAILGFLIMEALSRLGLICVGVRSFGEGDSYIAAGLGAIFGALLSSLPNNDFLFIFKKVVSILVLSGVIQIIFTLPMFIKRLIISKNWLTVGAISVFLIYAIGFIFAQSYGWLTHPVAFYSSMIVLILLGVLTCRELLQGLKENKEGGLYLPFGPSMIIAGFIALLLI